MSTRTAKARPAAPPAQGGESLPDLVAAEASRYRDRGDDLGALVADELDRLAQLIAFTHATTAAEHRDRFAVLEADRDEDHARRAYAEGYDHGRRDGRDLAFAEITTVLKRSAGIR